MPLPKATAGRVVVRTEASLVSVGTEKAMFELARKSLLGKARARPDLVKKVVDKVRTDGLLETWRQVSGRLDTPVQLGYSSAGSVVKVGQGTSGFRTGDRVACTGSGYAGHAEVVSVPARFCVGIPDNVDFESASFVALGGIALESVRMAHAELGSRVVVIGLGLIGQIAVQLLNAAGSHVFGIDIDAVKAKLAMDHGAEQTAVSTSAVSVTDMVSRWSGGHGADAVIIMASTETNEPLERAAEMCRERARIVATGMVGLEVPRSEFYDKELELVVSRGWGPGLYDSRYAGAGSVDYPLPYARWTAERNAQEFLSQMSKGHISTRRLISHRFALEDAPSAYEMILDGSQAYLGVVLTYPTVSVDAPEPPVAQPASQQAVDAGGRSDSRVWLKDARSPKRDGTIGVGVIGAGVFANGTFLPALNNLKTISKMGIAARTGLRAKQSGEKFNFRYCTTEPRDIIENPDVDLVTILTRHDSHAFLAAEVLDAGKHVFVEKPMAMDESQITLISDAYHRSRTEGGHGPHLMVGFNRRFSPTARWLKERLDGIAEPLSVNCVVNAGDLEDDSWVGDPVEGGGRIVGEVCHFIDLVQYLTSSTPVRVFAESVGSEGDDSLVATLTMASGAVAGITYVARGDKRYPRERIEVFGGGAVGAIENFRSAMFIRGGRRQTRRGRGSVDRGHRAEIEMLVGQIETAGPTPVELKEYVSTTLATFALERSLRSRQSELVEELDTAS